MSVYVPDKNVLRQRTDFFGRIQSLEEYPWEMTRKMAISSTKKAVATAKPTSSDAWIFSSAFLSYTVYVYVYVLYMCYILSILYL